MKWQKMTNSGKTYHPPDFTKPMPNSTHIALYIPMSALLLQSSKRAVYRFLLTGFLCMQLLPQRPIHAPNIKGSAKKLIFEGY
ncbi:MAG TPA: hypothetical protein PK239_06900, partial [Chitinophagales bacterium]|nr:hypothetical protein [Chitinophagales bacterium]